MNYGYEPTNFDRKLAKALEAIIAKYPEDARGQRAYVEVNQVYPGVRVRRLTHYSEDTLDAMVKEFDDAFTRLGAAHLEG